MCWDLLSNCKYLIPFVSHATAYGTLPLQHRGASDSARRDGR